MDTIHIESLSVHGKHGVYEEERAKPQEFIISVRMQFDTRAAGKSDELSDTIDYRDIRSIITEIVEGESCKLIERLAERIAEAILTRERRIAYVEVQIQKPMWNNGTPGITITRDRK